MSTSEKYPWHGIWGRRWKYAMASRKATWLSSIPRSTLSRAARYKLNLRTQRRASRSRHAPGAIATVQIRGAGHPLVELREVERNCAIAIRCTGEAGLGNGFIREVSLYQCWGTAMELLVMRPLTSVLVVLILAVAPVTVASAQVRTCVGTTCTSNPLRSPNATTFLPPLVNLPSPDPSTVDNPIPAPLPAPSQSSAINGPVSQPGLTPLPVPATPVTPAAPPSVFQSTSVPSVFQSQTGL